MPWGTSAINYIKNIFGSASWGAAAAGTKLGEVAASARAAAGQAMGVARQHAAAARSRLMATGPAARLGMFAGAGALYGATFGTDPGESRLGQAFAGAVAGAAIYGAGRYGRAAIRGAQLANLNLLGGRGVAAGVKQRGGWAGVFRGAGHGAYTQMLRDAQRATTFILGRKLNRPFNPVASTLKKTVPAPIDLGQYGTIMSSGGIAPAPIKFSAPAPISLGQYGTIMSDGSVVPAPVKFSAPAPVKFSAPAPVQFSVPAPVQFGAPTASTSRARSAPPVRESAPLAREYVNQELLDRIRTTRKALGMPMGVPLRMSPDVVALRHLHNEMRNLGIMR